MGGIAVKKQGVGGYRPDASGRLSGLAVAVIVHAAATVVLLQHQPMRSMLNDAVPIMVDFITPPKPVERPQVPPKPMPVRRNPQPNPPLSPAPLVTSVAEAPAPHVAPAVPVNPAPQVPVAAPAALEPAAAPPTPPLPVVQPSYNADYLQNPAPRYPPLARRMGQQGKVVLRVLVNPRGAAARVELRSSSGSELLDAAALEAVTRWRFVPARQGNEPVAAWVLVPITFSLQG